MSSDLMPNEKYAETEEEEMTAEDREDREKMYGKYDADEVYDRIRDDNSIALVEMVEEVIKNANNLMYFKNNPERIAQDIIQIVLARCNVRIEVQELSKIHQHIRATLRKPIKQKGKKK